MKDAEGIIGRTCTHDSWTQTKQGRERVWVEVEKGRKVGTAIA